jgi:oligopeptide/dipeptide ABC transporter ATP-binding protein
MSLLRVAGLSIRYGGTYAVRNLSFAVDRGESVGLVGESGSGKSQTALALLGLLPADAAVSGKAMFGDRDLLQANESALDALRARHIAMIFQDPMQALNPFLRVGQQLLCIVRRHRLAGPRHARQHIMAMLRRVGLPDPERQFDAYPHELSGGMRQRVMIASALIAEPELLVADEPTTALDVTVQAQVLELLESVRRDTALLLITHDLGIIAGHCQRMLVLRAGELVEEGATSAVFARPRHQHTKTLLAVAPRLDAAGPRDRTPGQELLVIDAASVTYRERRRRRLRAVRDVNLSVRTGETVAIVGESGSGKSSLARAMLGLAPLAAGQLLLRGAPLAGSVQARTRATRRELQLVFQDPVGSLDPQMTVADIVAEPLLVHEASAPAAERRDAVKAMLDSMGLGEEYLRRYPHQLSGGQAQRVAIARALIPGPKVLVCDEAVAALDGTARQQVLDLLRQVQGDSGLALIFISHDLAVVRSISHRVLVMYLGAVVELADNASLFRNPRHPYTRALLAAVPVPDPASPGGRAEIGGEAASALDPPSGCAFHPRCPHARDICRAERPLPRPFGGALVACHLAEEL